MMRKNRLLIAVMFLTFGGITTLQAQEAVTASGEDASGSGGTAAYTVGQVFYTMHTGTNGNNIVQGVQQPYEISVITETNGAENINLVVSAYPNPTTDFLMVRVENYRTDNLHFLLYDSNGRLIQSVDAAGQETKMETSKLVPAIYYLKIMEDKKEVKVFKIIKN